MWVLTIKGFSYQTFGDLIEAADAETFWRETMDVDDVKLVLRTNPDPIETAQHLFDLDDILLSATIQTLQGPRTVTRENVLERRFDRAAFDLWVACKTGSPEDITDAMIRADTLRERLADFG